MKPPKPISIPVYDNPVEQFARENPTLRKMVVDKKGKLTINFSKGMVFPSGWYNMQINDQYKKQNIGRRLQEGDDLPSPLIVDPYDDPLFELSRDQYSLDTIDPKKIEIKIKWDNPSIISMSSQNQLDRLILKWKKKLILTDDKGNNLMMDTAQEMKDE